MGLGLAPWLYLILCKKIQRVAQERLRVLLNEGAEGWLLGFITYYVSKFNA
jgi:hypothetical protein